MNTKNRRSIATPLTLVAAATAVLSAESAAAHGLAGKRFFPATLATDDPFVADELSLPTIESRKMPASGDEAATRETGYSVDVSKRLTDSLGIGFATTYATFAARDRAVAGHAEFLIDRRGRLRARWPGVPAPDDDRDREIFAAVHELGGGGLPPPPTEHAH
jgi:hypothetical protein